MNWWQYLLLVNLYLVLFYAFYSLLLRTETFFQLNRVYLVASAVLSFLIPLIQADWVRDLFITQKVQHTIYAYAGPEFVYYFKPAEEDHFTIGQLLLIIYITGAVILAAKFVWNLVSLKKIINQPAANRAFSFFKSIRVDPGIDNRDLITAHEEVHARQLHSADVLLMESVTIINWFNPVVYLYRLATKHIHEFIADQQAINTGSSKADYALLLLSQTLNAPTHQLVNSFFNHSLLKKRIIMLKKTQSRRTALLKYGLSAPLFILMMILSSATVSNSKTLKQIKQKIVDVVLLPPAPSNTIPTRTTQINTMNPVIKAETKTNTSVVKSVVDTTSTKTDNRIFTAVEQEPEFKGGISAFYQFLAQNIRYPETMRKNNIEGKVFVTFVVMKDGSLTDIKVVRGIGNGADEESMRVIKLSPKWNPGMQNGKPVNVQYTLPINFALGDKKTANDTTKSSGGVNKKTSYVFAGKQNTFGKYNQSAIANIDGASSKAQPLNPKDTSNTFSTAVVGSHTMVQGLVMGRVDGYPDQRAITVGSEGPSPKPLYIVDGKELLGIETIKASDIESINVLKDSTATKLFGNKAINGAVIVKTKNPTN